VKNTSLVPGSIVGRYASESCAWHIWGIRTRGTSSSYLRRLLSTDWVSWELRLGKASSLLTQITRPPFAPNPPGWLSLQLAPTSTAWGGGGRDPWPPKPPLAVSHCQPIALSSLSSLKQEPCDFGGSPRRGGQSSSYSLHTKLLRDLRQISGKQTGCFSPASWAAILETLCSTELWSLAVLGFSLEHFFFPSVLGFELRAYTLSHSISPFL
jgi:hypothetical protein